MVSANRTWGMAVTCCVEVLHEISVFGFLLDNYYVLGE